MDLTRHGGRQPRVVGAFPVNPGDQLVLVTDAGKLIRCPVHGIRIAGRSTRGVRLLDVAENERVVSVARLADDGQPNGDETNGDEVSGEPETNGPDGTGGDGTGGDGKTVEAPGTAGGTAETDNTNETGGDNPDTVD
jgi:DNA gyrase subunit A